MKIIKRSGGTPKDYYPCLNSMAYNLTWKDDKLIVRFMEKANAFPKAAIEFMRGLSDERRATLIQGGFEFSFSDPVNAMIALNQYEVGGRKILSDTDFKGAVETFGFESRVTEKPLPPSSEPPPEIDEDRMRQLLDDARAGKEGWREALEREYGTPDRPPKNDPSPRR